jgi:myo-inositol catabolism protein IolC
LRPDAWNLAYKAYTNLWRVQEADLDKLALHSRGELLAGLAQAAQRSAHAAESAQVLEKIITTMPGTPYAVMAKKWVDSPETAAKTNLTCRTCHEAGRLESRKAALEQPK